ncbi:MAG: hypothetical protein HONBIEJF_02766 [Fimbriimonadaceae bacterium]|nr:hypothetical protein [Fimbriimonadaceae bacterium]
MDIRTTAGLPRWTTGVRPDRNQPPNPGEGIPKPSSDSTRTPVLLTKPRADLPAPSEKRPIFSSGSTERPEPTAPIRTHNQLPGEEVPVPFWDAENDLPDPTTLGPRMTSVLPEPSLGDRPVFTAPIRSDDLPGEELPIPFWNGSNNLPDPTTVAPKPHADRPLPSLEQAKKILEHVESGDLSEVPSATQAKLSKLRKATQDLEALLLKDLVGKMRAGIGGSESSDPMKGMAMEMFDQQISASVSETGRVGIGSMIYNRLSKQILNADLTAQLMQGHVDIQG